MNLECLLEAFGGCRKFLEISSILKELEGSRHIFLVHGVRTLTAIHLCFICFIIALTLDTVIIASLFDELHEGVVLTDLSHMIVLETFFVKGALDNALLINALYATCADCMATSQTKWPLKAKIVGIVANLALILLLDALNFSGICCLEFFLDFIIFGLRLKHPSPDELHLWQIINISVMKCVETRGAS